MTEIEYWDPLVWVDNGIESHDDICLLLLHGVGGRSTMWSGVMRALALQGIAAQACDLPGYGANQAIARTFEQICLQLSASMIRLQAQNGCREFVLVGHSYGGMIVQEFLARSLPADYLVTGVALLCTSAAFGKTQGDFQQRFVESRLGPLRQGKTMLDVARSLVPGMVGSAPDPNVIEDAIAMMALVNPQTYESAIKIIAQFDQRNHLSKVTKKCLLLSAQEDKTAPPTVMQGMHERLPGSIYAQALGAGHLLPMEQPHWVARHLGETFFRSC